MLIFYWYSYSSSLLTSILQATSSIPSGLPKMLILSYWSSTEFSERESRLPWLVEAIESKCAKVFFVDNKGNESIARDYSLLGLKTFIYSYFYGSIFSLVLRVILPQPIE